MPELARQWFVPGEGIDRGVISSEIQRYLGNDATVRPGTGTGDYQGVAGYWIKAYRNLTSAMIADLKADSQRWRQEQRTTGRENFEGSVTYDNSAIARAARGREGESPGLDSPYGVVPGGRSTNAPTRMDIDPPLVSGSGRGQPVYAPENRGYPVERPFPGDSRSSAPGSNGAPWHPYDTGRSSVQATQSYVEPPRYAPSFGRPEEGLPPGYSRPGGYYPPVSAYESGAAVPARAEYQGMPPNAFGQQPPGRDRDRDHRDGRFPPSTMAEYPDSRYTYPSPATTVSSVSNREREPVTGAPQTSSFGTAPPPNQYDPYGARPISTSPGLSSVRTASSAGAPTFRSTPSNDWYPRR